MKKRLHKGKYGGFTLIEAAIAILVVGIVLVGALQVCNSSALILKVLKHKLRALNIAQAEIEEIKGLGYDGISLADYTPYKTTYVIIDEGATPSPDDDITGTMKTSVKDIQLTGYKIVVEMTWNAFDKAQKDVLETILYSYK